MQENSDGVHEKQTSMINVFLFFFNFPQCLLTAPKHSTLWQLNPRANCFTYASILIHSYTAAITN